MSRRGLVLALALAVAACGAAPATPRASAADFALVNRLTWGATPADLDAVRRLGTAGWIDAQFGPPQPLPPAVQARFDALPLVDGPIGAKVVELEQLRYRAVHSTDTETRKALYAPYREGWSSLKMQAIERSLIRDLVAPDQLRQQLTWFWFNHFNVGARSGVTAMLVGDYEETIRARVTGKFCELVRATLRHPAMIVYLNNAANTADKGNENYARELMELHTLGIGAGYTQGDVQTLARVLTGVGVDLGQWPPVPPPRGGLRDGLFVFDPAKHDGSAKTLLGQRLRGKGFAQVEEATTLLCRHPATATRIVTKLVKYFVADVPPPALVARLAQVFTATDGNIEAVMRALIASPEFTTSLGTHFKDPQHFMLSATRLALNGQVPLDIASVSAGLNRLEERRFARDTPDGFPLEADSWNASGQLAIRFDIAARTARGVRGALGNFEAVDLKPAHAAGIYPVLAPATQSVLSEARSASEWSALFLSSPEFMRR